MSRATPTISPPSLTPKTLGPEEEIQTIERSYRLITPLYGGGVDAGKPDEDRPISAKSIRGHLRFWWRATQSGQFGGSLEKMREKEQSIFGGIANGKVTHSAVQVWVSRPDDSLVVLVNFVGRVPQYAAFPMRDPDSYQELIEGGDELKFEFKITIHCPQNYRKHIEAALWAWETFGGVGARTRRGFGAFAQDQDNYSQIKGLNEQVRQCIAGIDPPNGVPFLQGSGLQSRNNLKISTEKWPSAAAAWEKGITTYQEFRSLRSGFSGRNSHNAWPEPEAIRALVNRTGQGKFPRAQLGLPIIFKFTSADDPQGQFTLSGKSKSMSRLASPIIIKPVIVATNAYRCIAVRLSCKGPLEPLENLVIKGGTENEETEVEETKVDSTLSSTEADQIDTDANYKIRTGAPQLNGNTAIASAFLNHFEIRLCPKKTSS